MINHPHLPVIGVAIGSGLSFLWGMVAGEIENREDKWFLAGAFMCLVGLAITLAW
jgi:drug/metabolite transporter superfamily protein YnfA